MRFELTNASATFQREINRNQRPVLGIELVLNTKININKDKGLVVVAYIDNILIATKWSIEKHHKQVGRVFHLLLENSLRVEIDKCFFDQKSVSFLGFIVDGNSIKMDPAKAKEIVHWPKPKIQWKLYN